MIIFIIIMFLVFFIGKFIYDSYFTDNTEKRWTEHQNIVKTSQKDVDKAQIMINYESYYKAKIKGKDGRIVYFVLFIIDEKYAFLIDKESIEKLGTDFNHISLLEVNKKMKTLGPISENDEVSYLDEKLGKYEIVDNSFKMKLFNQQSEYNTDINQPNVYMELSGEINNDKLILNIWSNSYNYYYPENSDDKFRRVLEHINIEFVIVNN